VNVYWLDFSKKERLYFSLKPGASHNQCTGEGHEWIIRDKETNRFIMRVPAQKEDIEVVVPKVNRVTQSKSKPIRVQF